MIKGICHVVGAGDFSPELLKLGEGEVNREICGEYPVFLLDDVFSELDENRRRFIMDNRQNSYV